MHKIMFASSPLANRAHQASGTIVGHKFVFDNRVTGPREGRCPFGRSCQAHWNLLPYPVAWHGCFREPESLIIRVSNRDVRALAEVAGEIELEIMTPPVGSERGSIAATTSGRE